MSQPLSEIVRAGRKARGLTQEQLAQSLYVSRQTISHWENGRAHPDYELLKRLAEVLEIPLTTLLGVEEEETPEPVAQEVCEMPEPAAEAPPQRKRCWRRTAVCAVLAAACVIAGLWWSGRPAEQPVPAAWFQQQETYEPEGARVSMAVLEEPVVPVYLEQDKSYLWEYDLYLREENGVSFTIDRLECHYYYADGGYHMAETSGERFGNGQNVLRANSVRKFTFEDRAAKPCLGVGLLLEGVDAGGSKRTFRCYIPYSAEN